MATPAEIMDRYTSSSITPKGFIEVTSFDGKELILISINAIGYIRVHDKKTYIMLIPQRHDSGMESIITSLSYDQVKALIATAQK
jgi:DNA-binding LytR/AlgR family response regulator